ncbi:hypothetical protein [uncultured Pseudomonas sp.]|nr:hypothetical protein [uncultured Pseudomonas sp.]
MSLVRSVMAQGYPQSATIHETTVAVMQHFHAMDRHNVCAMQVLTEQHLS